MAALFEFFRNEALNARNLFRAARPEAGVPPQSVRRYPRRSDPEQQDVLLRRLAGHAAAHRHHAIQRRSDAGAAAGHLHPADLRSRVLAANAVSEQHDSRQPLRSDRRSGPAALSAAQCRRAPTISSAPPPNPTIRIRPISGSTATSAKRIASSAATPSSATTTRRSRRCPMAAAA